jgi:hypothetical protein
MAITGHVGNGKGIASINQKQRAWGKVNTVKDGDHNYAAHPTVPTSL